MLNPLTPSLTQLLELFSEGMTHKQAAQETGKSVHTVRTQSTKILNELGADNMVHAVAIAIRKGFIQ